MFSLRNCRIGIVGLGYVGLPLAVEFGRQFDTMGFDLKADRIRQLQRGRDSTLETTSKELRAATRLKFTTRLMDLRRCRIFIVTVPTPIDEFKRPDLSPLVSASSAIGEVLKKGDIVVYESRCTQAALKRSACRYSSACQA